MWTFLGVIFIFLKTVQGFENESSVVPDVMDILRSDSFNEVSEICERHMKEYLMSREYWALRMIDSTAKIPDGIFLGHVNIPGQYDECVTTYNDQFSGKHCMVKFNVTLQNKKLRIPQPFKNRNQNSLIFTFGLCVPSTCNASDLEALLNSLPYEFIKSSVNDNDCSISGYRPLRTEDWVTIGILTFFFLITGGSTAYELFQRFRRNNEKPNELLSAFSVYSNGKSLLRISKNATQLKCLHGIRFLSMCWVILGHSYFSYLLGIPINIIDAYTIMKETSFIPVNNAFVSVDSFFFLSGLLVCLVFFRDISKKKSFDVPVAFIHRYIRLTPPFAILMLIQSTIISRIGNGPFWNERSDSVEKACRESWWSGLLYVQNYLHPTSMCLGQAWYLSADMQMYWISPLILYPLLWFPSIGPYFILILLSVAASVTFAVSFVNNLAPNILMTLSGGLDQFKLEYTPFHTRMAPWIIGLATGYIICGIQAKKIKIKLSKLYVVTGWILAGFLLGGSLFGISKFLSSDQYTQLEASLYLTFHRIGWALGMAWVVIACVTGYGGPINEFLSFEYFEPLGKLAYCNFLIHMTLQNYRINSSRVNQYLRHFDIVYSYLGDLLLSNLISIPVALLFEFPFTKIDRYLFQSLKIFPFPRPTNDENLKVIKSEKQTEKSQDLEKGNENPVFKES